MIWGAEIEKEMMMKMKDESVCAVVLKLHTTEQCVMDVCNNCHLDFLHQSHPLLFKKKSESCSTLSNSKSLSRYWGRVAATEIGE